MFHSKADARILRKENLLCVVFSKRGPGRLLRLMLSSVFPHRVSFLCKTVLYSFYIIFFVKTEAGTISVTKKSRDDQFILCFIII